MKQEIIKSFEAAIVIDDIFAFVSNLSHKTRDALSKAVTEKFGVEVVEILEVDILQGRKVEEHDTEIHGQSVLSNIECNTFGFLVDGFHVLIEADIYTCKKIMSKYGWTFAYRICDGVEID